MVLAYPVSSNEAIEIVAKRSWRPCEIESCCLKFGNANRSTLDEAYRTALRLEAYQKNVGSEL